MILESPCVVLMEVMVRLGGNESGCWGHIDIFRRWARDGKRTEAGMVEGAEASTLLKPCLNLVGEDEMRSALLLYAMRDKSSAYCLECSRLCRGMSF